MLSDGQETSKGTIFAKYVLRPIIASSVVYYSNLKKIYMNHWLNYLVQ